MVASIISERVFESSYLGRILNNIWQAMELMYVDICVLYLIIDICNLHTAPGL